MAPWQRITLVAAGAGAGIAATFNTPIGGVMFAIELMMPEVSARTFLPVALATGTATFIGRIFFGMHPAFAIPDACWRRRRPASLAALLLYAMLGAHHRAGGRRLYPRPQLRRGYIRADRKPLSAPRRRHADRRRADLRAVAHRRPLLCRGRRLFHHPGDSPGNLGITRRSCYCYSSPSSPPPR